MSMSSGVVSLFLASMFFSASGSAAEREITISESATYYDEKIIAPNIRSECTNLGRQFSESTKKYLSEKGWAVDRSDELPDTGMALNLVITNAHSGGNAWSGHKKSVSIEVEMYRDGELVDTYEGIRNSSGGFGGGFKGSCDVLKRCVNTLGKDVAKWLGKS